VSRRTPSPPFRACRINRCPRHPEARRASLHPWQGWDPSRVSPS
jgi:hypothetical protein